MLIFFLREFPDLTHQGIPKLRPKPLPSGNLHVKRNVIVLLKSLEGDVVKGIRRLDEISLLTERKSDPRITSKNCQAVMRIVFQCKTKYMLKPCESTTILLPFRTLSGRREIDYFKGGRFCPFSSQYRKISLVSFI